MRRSNFRQVVVSPVYTSTRTPCVQASFTPTRSSEPWLRATERTSYTATDFRIGPTDRDSDMDGTTGTHSGRQVEQNYAYNTSRKEANSPCGASRGRHAPRSWKRSHWYEADTLPWRPPVLAFPCVTVRRRDSPDQEKLLTRRWHRSPDNSSGGELHGYTPLTGFVRCTVRYVFAMHRRHNAPLCQVSARIEKWARVRIKRIRNSEKRGKLFRLVH